MGDRRRDLFLVAMGAALLVLALSALAAPVQRMGSSQTVFSSQNFTPTLTEIEVTSVNAPLNATVNESIEINVKVENKGNLTGSENITLSVDGSPLRVKVVTLEPGEERTINFTISLSESGIHTINISGISEDIKVLPAILEEPPKGYVWRDFSLKTVTLAGKTYNTGIYGKALVPREVSPANNYSISLYFNREKTDISRETLSNLGISLCVGPGINISLYNPGYWDLYLHFGIGVTSPLRNYWDRWMVHWPIRVQRPERLRVKTNVSARLQDLEFQEIKPGGWEGTYNVTVRVEKVKEEKTKEQIIRDEISPEIKSNLGHFYRLTNNFGIYIEKEGEKRYSVGLYQRNLNSIKVCAGPGIVISLPIEIWIHGGFGTGRNWDQYMKHVYLASLALEETASKPPMSGWGRVDYFSVKCSRANPSIEQTTSYINGYFEGVATSSEEKAPVKTLISNVSLYSVKVRGNFTTKRGDETKLENVKVYYIGSKNFSTKERVTGYLKMVKRGETRFLSALDEGYYLGKRREPVEGQLNLTATTDEKEIGILNQSLGLNFTEDLYTVDVYGSVDGVSFLGFVPLIYEGEKDIQLGDRLVGKGALYPEEGYIDAYSNKYWVEKSNITENQTIISVRDPTELPETVPMRKGMGITLESVSPRKPIKLNITGSTLGEVKIEVKNNVSGIKVEMKRKNISRIEVKPKEETYQAFEIDVANISEETIKSANIEFSVPKKWLETKEVDSKDIILQRYHNGWNELPTKVIGGNLTYVKYRAETPGFSTFAITTKVMEEEASFSLSNLTISKKTVKLGEQTEVSVEISNTGGARGSITVNLSIEGEVVKDRTVTLSPGESEVLRFAVSRQETGTYNISIGKLTGNFEVVKPSPEFEVISLNLSEETVRPGGNVIVNVTVENIGGSRGSYKLEVKLNGEVAREQTITLSSEERRQLQFTLSREREGKYTLQIGDESESFQVKKEEEKVPGFTSLAAMVTLLAATLILYRRKNFGNEP